MRRPALAAFAALLACRPAVAQADLLGANIVIGEGRGAQVVRVGASGDVVYRNELLQSAQALPGCGAFRAAAGGPELRARLNGTRDTGFTIRSDSGCEVSLQASVTTQVAGNAFTLAARGTGSVGAVFQGRRFGISRPYATVLVVELSPPQNCRVRSFTLVFNERSVPLGSPRCRIERG